MPVLQLPLLSLTHAIPPCARAPQALIDCVEASEACQLAGLYSFQFYKDDILQLYAQVGEGLGHACSLDGCIHPLLAC